MSGACEVRARAAVGRGVRNVPGGIREDLLAEIRSRTPDNGGDSGGWPGRTFARGPGTDRTAGQPPGKSQGDSVLPRTTWLRRAGTCCRAKSATGAGGSTGTAPKRMRTALSVSSMWSMASREIAAGHRAAVASDALPVQWLVDADHPVAARAGGPDHPGDPGLVQQVDEPQDGAVWRQVSLPVSRRGLPSRDRTALWAIVRAVGCRPAESLGDRIAVGAGGDRSDQFMVDRGRITGVGVGTLLAAGQTLVVAEADASDVASGGALGSRPLAVSAGPVLALCWRVRGFLPHSAQTGTAIAEAPTLRS